MSTASRRSATRRHRRDRVDVRPRDGDDEAGLFARGPQGDDDQVENEEAFPRVANESFIQRLLLEGDQLDS